ncbi:IPT/TIG domain-containing protein [Dyella choica]|nr:IPT/TIG domain-containing protein [Dyella choica]
MLGLGEASAQSTSYVYDANGRVVAVTASNGTSVQYSYNTLGHTSQIGAPLSPGQLAIFAFTPTHGEAGAQVTLQGQGFDSNAANDTVSFNGTVASVLSASSTQLVTSVPSGATTGPISVTVGTQKATSATPFVIDDTGVPPTITQVSPQLVSVGSTVTVTGTHLDPMAGYTTVETGGRAISALSSVSDTQLQYVVPSNAATGYVTVATPYGSATSTMPVIVLPSSVSASSVASSNVAAVNGGSVNLNIASGQVAAVTFTTSQSGWVSLQATGITTSASTINYTVYAPGNGVVQQGTVSSTSPSIHLPHLLGGATYLVLVQPSGGSAQMALGVEEDSLLATNIAATVVTAVPGQTKRLLFYASTGQNLAFQINTLSTNPPGNTVTYTVYTPTGVSYTSATTSTTGVINLGNLVVPGTYQVVVAPSNGVTVNTQVQIAPGVGGTLSATPHAYTANVPGQNVYLSFTATQGENLELSFNHITLTGASSNSFLVYVYNGSGAQVTNFWCSPATAGASCLQHLWYLPAGTYSVVATPVYGGVIGFNALLQDDIVGPTVSTNGTASITLAAGQVERLTFNANAGDTLALNVGGVTTTPNGLPVQFLVYRPDAGAITLSTPAYTSLSPAGAQTVNLPNLPVSGTYTVIVVPYAGLPTSTQLSVIGGATGTLSTTSASQSFTGSVSAQNIYLSFTATQDENLELLLSNVTGTGSSANGFNVGVFNSTGGQVTNFFCYPSTAGSSCLQALWHLPAGTYSVVATPNGDGVIGFNAKLQDDIIGPAIATGSTANITLAAGQVERYTFNANAGDTVALNVSGATTTPSGPPVAFLVYRPDAGAITLNTPAYTWFRASGALTVNLPNLPVSGTYTVIVAPSYGLPASAQLSVIGGATGTLSTTAAAQSFTGKVSAQNIYLSFTATQGENLELLFNNVTGTGSSANGFYVNVYNSTGGVVTSFWCYPSNTSCLQHLWNLPAGTYSVVAPPSGDGVIGFSARLQDDLIGPTIATGGTANITLGAGQVERYTFHANAGDTLALNVSGATTTPAGPSVSFLVYRPDAGSITVNTAAYTSFNVAGTQTVNLPNLPVSGTYTVIVSPAVGFPASAQLSVIGGETGTATTTSVPQNYAANVAGENIYLSFTATQGENLELLLNNLSLTGASSNQFYVSVYNSTGTQVVGFACSTGVAGANCLQHLWYMAAGTYSVVVTPNYGGLIGFSATLQDDIVGPAIATGGTANIALGLGQVGRYTFNANAGDTVALGVSGVTSTPSGFPVSFLVYRPDAGAITVNTPTYMTFSATSAQTANLSSLPISGAYTVIVAPTPGTSVAAALSVTSDTAGPPPVYGTPTLPTTGAVQSENASAAGQNVTMTFNANQGDNLELTLSNINVAGASLNGFYVNVSDPTGANVASYPCYASNPGASCRQALWNLTAGTYTVVVSPNWGGTVSFNAQVEPDVVGPALVAGTSTPVTLSAGQVQRLTFHANVGDTVALNVSGVSATSPAGQYVYVNIYRPDTGAIAPGNYYTYTYTGGSATFNLPNLPASGTYTVVVYTAYGTPATAQLALYSGATGSLVSNAAAQSFTASTTGQNAYFTFHANLGDNQELTLSNINVAGSSNNGFTVNVYDPNGTNVAYFTCYASNPGASCRQPLWNLTAGTYSVVVLPTWGGVMSFNAQLTQDVVGPTLSMSTPASINLGAGQVQRLTFNANVGDTVALALSGASSSSPAGQYVYVNIYRPDTGPITTNNYYTYTYTGGSATFNLQNLPATGTYTVVVSTAYGTPATAQLALYPGATGNVVSNGTTQSFAASTAGENVYFTFNAQLGDNQELTLNNINVAGSSTNSVAVNITGPGGTFVASYNCNNADPGSSCRQPLWNLAAGTYSVVVSPVSGGAPSFTAQLAQDVVGPSLTMSTPATINLGSGQVQRLTFNANVGDTVALTLSGVSTTLPTGQNVYVYIYRPDTGAITANNYYTYTYTGGSITLNLKNLPASGTYTAMVYTYYGTPATAQLTLYPGATGNMVSNGPTQAFAASTAGENAYFTFQANLGDNQELTLSNINVPGSSTNGFTVNITDPSGTNIASYLCYNSNPGSSCRQPLWNLAAGTYTVVVSPAWGGTPSFTAQLTQDVVGPVLAVNSPASITLGSGQVERLTFNGSLGQNVILNLTGVSTTAPTGQPVTIYVYRPDTGAITTTNYYATTNATSSGSLTLPGLPAAGTYTVIAYTADGTPATAQLTIPPH